MMMTKNNNTLNFRNPLIAFCVILFISLGYSCNNNDNSSNKIENPTNKIENSTHGLKLNEGIKWKANAETIEGVNNMIVQIKEWQESGDSPDATLLKNDLEAEFKMIFKRCTMTGDAHDQLHNYLMPLKEFIDCVDESDSEKFNTCMINLEEHLQLFSEYFE